jgi:ubiquinone/menaquinone biosynthesis C-methylase UbiE
MTAATDIPAIFDDARAEAFADGLLDIINHGALSLMISVGHRTGLFDTMSKLDWATSEAIAEAADLDERYVREWLGAVVTGRIVEYTAGSATYRLPPEHAACLTRAVGGDNLGQTAQWISVLGYVEDPVVDKFHNGGGVNYCEFNRFHEVMACESQHSVVGALEEHILPLAPGLIDRLQAGLRVLEIGCGSGRAICRLAELFPNSTFSAYDFCDDAVEIGEQARKEKGLTNLRFETRDITQLEESEVYDLVLAFDVIHDQKDPAAVLSNVRKVLKEGGTFLMQDIAASSHLEKNMDHPLGPLFYTTSTMHCMTVSLAQDGKGLGAVWGEELAVEMLSEAGFADVRVETLEHDIINNYYIMTK